ncbi:hypothetical protein EFD32_0105 [Enterococcus faecalis D32]|nr:hypothetical protein EFD32_0105 [Enterococcus faecalis D32]
MQEKQAYFSCKSQSLPFKRRLTKVILGGKRFL